MDFLSKSGGSDQSIGDAAKFGIVTVSDRASRGQYADESGPAILQFFHDAVDSPWVALYKLVPDEQADIEAALKDLVRACEPLRLPDLHDAVICPGNAAVTLVQADKCGCSLIVTTGGTGPAPRDVTPEATARVCEKILPGYGEQMRAISLKFVPTAVLSRQMAGVRGKSFIINLPGKPKSIRETFDEVFQSIPYCIDLIGGPYIETKDDSVVAFRPPKDRRARK